MTTHSLGPQQPTSPQQRRRLTTLLRHLLPPQNATFEPGRRKSTLPQLDTHDTAASSAAAAEDELDVLVRRAEEMRMEQEYAQMGTLKSSSNGRGVVATSSSTSRQGGAAAAAAGKFLPYLIVPTFVEESTRVGQQKRERRRKRVKILYDVTTARAQTPMYLDVSQDDPKTPLAFRYIRIILLTAEARRAQDIHLDQHSSRAMSIVFATQLGVTGRIVLKGAVVQSIIYYLAFYDMIAQGKQQAADPGPVRDYKLSIKVRTHAFLSGTHNVYRVNCIRTNHELLLYHVVMRVLQS